MLFQRLDTGETVSVSKPVVIVFGEANIEINGQTVRCKKLSLGDAAAPQPPVVSMMGLGFPQQALEQKREHCQRHSLSGVEFKPDPTVPEFYNVHFSGPEERKRYEKTLGYENTSGTNGGRSCLNEQLLEQAKSVAVRLYG